MERQLVVEKNGTQRLETLAEALERKVTDLEGKVAVLTRAVHLMSGRLPAGERDEILAGLGIEPAQV